MNAFARLLLLTAALWLTAFSSYSQTLERCLSIAQMGRLNDSLRVLPPLRKTVLLYRQTADSLLVADGRHKAAYQQEQTATASLAVLLENSEGTTADWKHKAIRNKILNYLLLSALGGLGYLTLK